MNLSYNLQSLVYELEKTRPAKPSQIVSLIRQSPVNEADPIPCAAFDHEGSVSYGKNLVCRFLAPVFRVRSYFEKYFESVDLYDAVSLKSLGVSDDSCASTRYIVVARR